MFLKYNIIAKGLDGHCFSTIGSPLKHLCFDLFAYWSSPFPLHCNTYLN